MSKKLGVQILADLRMTAWLVRANSSNQRPKFLNVTAGRRIRSIKLCVISQYLIHGVLRALALSEKSNDNKKPALFTRQSTGLVKSISATDVLFYTLSRALADRPDSTLGVTTLPSIYEGVDLPLVFGLSLILLITVAYNTICLSATLPRAGGDYVFGSRIVNPIWGMIPSFMVEFSFVVGIASLAVVALEAFIGPAIITSYPQYAQTVSSLDLHQREQPCDLDGAHYSSDFWLGYLGHEEMVLVCQNHCNLRTCHGDSLHWISCDRKSSISRQQF